MAELRETNQSQREEREEDEEEGGEEDEGSGEFLPGYPTFEDYSKVSNDRSEHIASNPDHCIQLGLLYSTLVTAQALLSQVMQATRSANSLPAEGDDFDYYSSFQGFKTFCSKMGDRANRR